MKNSIVAFCLIILVLFSCDEKSVNWESDTTFYYKSSKCMADYSLSSSMDSSFVYSFEDSLVIDFSVRANCCPDSDRFDISYVIRADTIIIAVADTAQNLCYCTCPYTVHTVFQNLEEEHHIICCTISNYQGTIDPLYLVEVYRRE